MSWSIGFDTSNYTTSAAAFNDNDLISITKILPVKQGMRGIRQNDAVFHHVKQLPILFKELSQKIDIKEVCAVGVSTRPRNVENSYMPVFTVGEGFAECVSASLGIPIYKFSHQDGHIMAAIHSSDVYNMLEKEFISVHLSGGTTEILVSKYTGIAFDNKIIGGTTDISAGQFIDRAGVAMGLAFPAGKELSLLSKDADAPAKLPAFVDESYISYSGVETKVQQLINDKKYDYPSIALGVLKSIGDSLAKALKHAVEATGIKDIVLSGGVASNEYIKFILENELDFAKLYFANPELSCDNASGIAIMSKGIINNIEKYGQLS